MLYKTTTKASNERLSIIGSAVAASTEELKFYEYQNREHRLKVINLKIDVPIYRMANFRTRVDQQRYSNDHGLDQVFFSTGQENESVQQAQHALLVKYAKQGRAESIKPIFEDLKEEPQRDPILITSDGVVVNGNRRLSAMRELFAESSSLYRHFSHVTCAVLPSNVSPDDIREIEVRLQMQAETKLPYGWVNESIAIKELRDSGKNLDYIASLMKKNKKEVERARRALVEADLYLSDWVKSPGDYTLVESSQQFFSDLATAVGDKEGDSLELSRRLGWLLITNQSKLRGRLYDYNVGFGKNAEEIAATIAERVGIELMPPDTADDEDAETLAVDLGTDPDLISFEPFIEICDDPARRDIIADQLITVCDSYIEQARQGEIGKRALASANMANTKLQEIDLTKADVDSYEALKSQLDSIINRARHLDEALGRLIEKL